LGDNSPGVKVATGLGNGITNISVENGVAREVNGGDGPGEDQDGGGRLRRGGGRFLTFPHSTSVEGGEGGHVRTRREGVG
jgi:hypothetical protein